MGIRVNVLRSHHDQDSWLGDVDCTNGGITNHKNGVHRLTIINADGPFEPDAGAGSGHCFDAIQQRQDCPR